MSNASPLIGLAKAQRLSLLRRLYGQILIPPQVYADVVIAGRGRAGSRAIRLAVQQGWMQIVPVRNTSEIPARLVGTGEGEAIALAGERKADLIVDDRVARRECDRRGVTWITTVGVVREAKHRRLIRRAKPIFDRMIAAGFGIADYEDILHALGE